MIIADTHEKNKYLDKYGIHNFFSFHVYSYLEVHSYKKGDYISKELETLSNLYFLVEGRAKMYQNHKNGKVSLIHFYNSGSILGEVELLDLVRTSSSVQAMIDTICIVLPLRNCRDMVLNDAKFLRVVAKYMGTKMLKDTVHLIASQAYPLENRLASFILLSSNNGIYDEKHVDVSQHLGVSYRHLSRVITEFCDKGIVEKKGRSYIIKDYNYLKKLCDEMDLEQ